MNNPQNNRPQKRAVLQAVLWGAVLVLGTLPFASTGQGVALAAPTDESAETTGRNAAAPAGQFVQELGNKAIKVIADKNLMPEQRSEHYHGLLRESFDLPTIGRFVLCRAWKTATPEQQKAYMELFEALIINIYGDKLSFYTGESFRVTGSRPEGENDFVVNSEVIRHSGTPPIKVDWRVRQKNGKPAVLDVVIEGVSQSITQRQEYASILQSKGGKIEELLKVMRERLEKDRQGKPSSP
jgi:phospholipid transport system substrate-binding protein